MESSMWTCLLLSALKEERGLEDYENFSAALAFRTPNRLNDGTAESSEDEMELCYTRVHFTAKPGCEQGSGTCEGEETQYSEVKFWVNHKQVLKFGFGALLYILFINMCEQIIKLHFCNVCESSLVKSAAYVGKILCCVFCHFSPPEKGQIVWKYGRLKQWNNPVYDFNKLLSLITFNIHMHVLEHNRFKI